MRAVATRRAARVRRRARRPLAKPALRCSARRSVNGIIWFASATASGKIQRVARDAERLAPSPPSRRSAPRPDRRSTASSAASRTETPASDCAPGRRSPPRRSARATTRRDCRPRRPHSPPGAPPPPQRCFSIETPSAARSAFSIIAYCETGMNEARPSARRETGWARGVAVPCRASYAACAVIGASTPAIFARSARWRASAPVTSTTSARPAAMSAAARPSERRLQDAELGDLRARLRRAEMVGNEATRVGVVPEAARCADRIGAGEQLRRARVLRCALERRDHQRERLARAQRIFLALRDRAHAHQHRRPRIQRQATSPARLSRRMRRVVSASSPSSSFANSAGHSSPSGCG